MRYIGNNVLTRGNTLISPSVSYAAKRVLAICCLAMDYFATILIKLMVYATYNVLYALWTMYYNLSKFHEIWSSYGGENEAHCRPRLMTCKQADVYLYFGVIQLCLQCGKRGRASKHSENSVNFFQAVRRNATENNIPHSPRLANLTSLPSAAARVRDRVRSCGICGGQSDSGAGFLLALRFPIPILSPPIAPQLSSSIIWGWYNRPKCGRSTKWTQSHPMRKNPYISHTYCQFSSFV
jgi:hypothetical protein